MSNDYSISEKIYEFLKEEKLCDVTLIAGLDNTRIPAHRLVLCAATEYFWGLLNNSLKEKEQCELTIANVNGQLLKALVDCCYTGRIAITDENVTSLLSAASFFLFAHLKKKCVEYLSQPGNLNIQNCIEIWDNADRCHYPDIKQMASTILFENFLDLSKYEEFYLLNKSKVLEIVESDEIAVNSDFNAIVRWVQFNAGERMVEFAKVVRGVRVNQLRDMFMYQEVLAACEQFNCEETFIKLCKLKRTEDKPNIRKAAKNPIEIIAVRCDGTRIFKYSCGLNQWTALTDISPIDRICFGAEIIDGKLYIIGGYYHERYRYSNVVESIDMKSFERKTLQPISSSRSDILVFAIENFIYAVGGGDLFCSGIVERYDIKSDKWTTLSPLLKSRGSAAVANLSGNIFVMGGWVYSYSGLLSSVESYDPVQNKWSAVAPMIHKRCAATAGVANGYIYVVGGQNEMYKDETSIERYDPNSNTWTLMAFQICPSDVYFGMTVFGNWVFVARKRGEILFEKINLLTGEREELRPMLDNMNANFLLLNS